MEEFFSVLGEKLALDGLDMTGVVESGGAMAAKKLVMCSSAKQVSQFPSRLQSSSRLSSMRTFLFCKLSRILDLIYPFQTSTLLSDLDWVNPR